MSLTYIAGYDGSEASSAAVAVARSLARSAGADVLAVNVYPSMSLAYMIGAESFAPAELEKEFRLEAERLLGRLEGVERRAVQSDSPAHGLHDVAEAEAAALLAVGTTHHGRLGRLAAGSVGARLLHGAPCPVIVVPPRSKPQIETIGVAWDARRESRVALEHAERLASQVGARLLLLAVHDPVTMAGPAMVQGTSTLEAAVRRALETGLAKAVAGITAVDADARLLIGSPGSRLAEAAEDVDLIVAGSRSYGPLRSVLLGSVSRQLVDHAPCPVLIVPRSAAQEGEREPRAVSMADPDRTQ